MIIYGFDLGVTSIGFAVIIQTKESTSIQLLGSRIVSLTTDDKTEFSKGQAISKNRARNQKHGARLNLDRYQLRRSILTLFLKANNMMPTEKMMSMPKEQLWNLRSKATNEQITLQELGRVLYHLNQKRGYKSTRAEEDGNKTTTDYLEEIRTRSEILHDSKLTIGQFFYNELQKDSLFRIRQKIYPRADYEKEFDRIIAEQAKYYPSTLTPERIQTLRNEIIYYQRPLKSKKGLVSLCEFESHWSETQEGKKVFIGPRVAHRSNPIAQMTHLWERINNISISHKNGIPYRISLQQKEKIFHYLTTNDKLKQTELFELLGEKSRNFIVDKNTFSKGITGDTTRLAIRKVLANTAFEHLLEFDPPIIYSKREDVVDEETGEVFAAQEMDAKAINTPYYCLWHTIYSIDNMDECTAALTKQFNLPEELALKLSKIDFTKLGYANKSVKAMRKLLPYLREGMVYSDAATAAGYNHSNSTTKKENQARELLDKLPSIPKNSLRQPIVEKILNQLVNITNTLLEEYGRPDEIHVELTRELKQTAKQRKECFKSNTKREAENQKIGEELKKLGLPVTRRNIIKYRLFTESETGVNCTCLYCGGSFGLSAAMNGEEVDVDHIIPQALRFDDSQNNKILVHRTCNADKGMRTAYDFLRDKSEDAHKQYMEQLSIMYEKGKITKPKYDRLMMKRTEIPQDFIERQLRQSQYIARKSAEIMQQICHRVVLTGGGITEYLRRIWGWDDVLHNLQFEKYKAVGQTETVKWESTQGIHSKEQITNWSKRCDHRHHAIDALIVACTKQGFIQRINTLSAEETQKILYEEAKELLCNERSEKRSKLDAYFLLQKPLSTAQLEKEVDKILVSCKAGKRVATWAKRTVGKGNKKKIVQRKLVTPRGSLSEESVYGIIKIVERNVPTAILFERVNEILKPPIRKIIADHLAKFDGNVTKAKNALEKEPLYLDKEQDVILTHATCLKKEAVIRKPIDPKICIEKVVDDKIRNLLKQRLALFNYDPKKAFINLDENPIFLNAEKKITIRNVRIRAGLKAIEPLRYNENGLSEAFVKPGNNHHVAIYKNNNGTLSEHVCTFWHAVERFRFIRQVVISDSSQLWNCLREEMHSLPQSFLEKLPVVGQTLFLSMQQNEMFILGLSNEQITDALDANDYPTISKHLYRVQSISECDYYFRHHLETMIDNSKASADAKRFYRVRSTKAMIALNPTKIQINHIGKIRIEKR